MKRLLLMLICILTLPVSTAFAEVTANVTIDPSTNYVTVSSEMEEKNMQVAVSVLKSDVKWEDITQADGLEKLAYFNQGKTDKDGKFTFSWLMKGTTGEYKVRICMEKDGIVRDAGSFYFTSPEEFAEAMAKVNKAQTAADLRKAITENETVLSLADKKMSEKSDLFYASLLKIKSNLNSSFDSYEALTDSVFEAEIVDEISQNDGENIEKLIKDNPELIDITKLISYDIYNDSEMYNDERRMELLAFAAEKEFYTMKEFAEVLDENIVLFGCFDCDWTVVSDILEKSKLIEEFDLASYEDLKDKSDVCKFISASDEPYESLKTLTEAIIEFIDDEEDNNSGKGSSGGGGSSGGVKISAVTPQKEQNEINNETENKMENENITYSDMQDFEWANEAVSFLSNKGIIKGKADGIFAPADFVTREEFAKLLVLAFDKLDENADADFSDASVGAWYYPYIASAYRAGIVNGMGDGSFGVGKPISRQDMAVMVYNAMKACGKAEEITTAKEFADSENISEYAKEAVSYLYEKGIVSGMGENRFAPEGETNRAAAAQVIYRVTKGGASND